MQRNYKKYAQKIHQRTNQIKNKYHKQHVISRILTKWQNRKLGNDDIALHQSERNDYAPIWRYRKMLMGDKKTPNTTQYAK